MKSSNAVVVLIAAVLSSFAGAQSTTATCGPAPSGSIKPSVASGYKLQVVATGLSRPRGLAIDGAGNLLVVQAGLGSISAHTFNESSGCLTLASTKNVTGSNMALNHGIEVSADGRTLYASSTENVYSWDYSAANMSISNQRTLVSNMSGTDHTTRTLLLSRKAPGMLAVARGSTENIDIQAATLNSGISQVRAFNISDRGREGDRVYQYDVDGMRMGWGLRNEVGIGEHPNSGGIWGVENSADQINRMGVDVHQNNPGEELNFLGYLNGTRAAQQGGNYGYPWCFAVWDAAALPNNANLSVGQQFAVSPSQDSNNTNRTDEYCAQQVAPRLTFQAHMAPLDIKFNSSGTQAWITFHGSWNRDVPVGYKLSLVNFTSSGEPTEPANSTRAAVDIVSNQNISSCPGNCLRPVAMAIDRQGRIFMSSDASGEIYLVSRDTGSTGTSSASPSASGVPSSTASGSATSTGGAVSNKLFIENRGVKLYGIGTFLSCLMTLLI